MRAEVRFPPAGEGAPPGGGWVRFVATWIVLAAFWLGLSGHFDAVHLALGFVSVTLVSAISAPHLTGGGGIARALGALLRLLLYVPWLLGQIVLANVDVLLRVVGARPVNPRIVRFRPDLESDFAAVALANSITLTPGTVTIEIEDGHFIVHAIAPESAESLLSGRMEARLRWVEGRAP